MQNKNNNISSVSVKPVHSRYISLDEDIFIALNAFETRVYMALRYHTDFKKKSSEIEITIDDLIEESKIKRRMLFHCLNALEKKFFLIRRLNWGKGTFGKTNEYEVAQHLNYFKPFEKDENQEKPDLPPQPICENCNNNISSLDNINGSYKEGVHTVHTVVHGVHTVDDPVHTVHTVGNEKEPYPETYYPVPEETKKTMTVPEMLQSNPLNLPAQMIEDWVINRKAKKSPVTVTAWIRLNKQLMDCPNPIEAFEECVAAGWVSFKSEWVKKPKEKKSHFDNESTDWAKGIEQDMF